jgi:hypothetical protein
MLADIIEVKVVKNYILYIRFKDGVSGEVDVSQIIPFQGIFSRLKDPATFLTVRVDPELGTIVWDNGADLAPDFLYSVISGHGFASWEQGD